MQYRFPSPVQDERVVDVMSTPWWSASTLLSFRLHRRLLHLTFQLRSHGLCLLAVQVLCLAGCDRMMGAVGGNRVCECNEKRRQYEHNTYRIRRECVIVASVQKGYVPCFDASFINSFVRTANRWNVREFARPSTRSSFAM